MRKSVPVLEIGASQPVPATPWAEKARKLSGSVLTGPQPPHLSFCPDGGECPGVTYLDLVVTRSFLGEVVPIIDQRWGIGG